MDTETFQRHTFTEQELLARLGLGPGSVKHISVIFGEPNRVILEVRPGEHA